MIYSVEQTARIFNAMRAVELANNGYATLSLDTVTADALRTAGYVVTRAVDLFGLPAFRVFTKAGYKAAAFEVNPNEYEF